MKKILVIEDDADICEMLPNYLIGVFGLSPKDKNLPNTSDMLL